VALVRERTIPGYVKLKLKTDVNFSHSQSKNIFEPKFQNTYLQNCPYDCKATNGAIV
jgi:hypothetical protein